MFLYGSHLHGARPGRHSALDLVIVVEDYRRFYDGLCTAGEIHRPAWLLVALAHVLPPNVIAFQTDEAAGDGALAKCLVVSRRHLERALAEKPPDHFLLSRMVQEVGLVWAKDANRRSWVMARIQHARAGVLAWVGPFLPAVFDAGTLGRTMMEVSYRAEFRPEAADRSEVIFESQKRHFESRFTPILKEAASAGVLERTDGGYRYTAGRKPRRVAFGRGYFARSKARVTARWLKHVLTFDKWLPYIVRKVERRTGTTIELTRLERRWPVIFLWPRVIRVLRYRPDTEEPS
ncbi:MAG: hypothetical protein P8170_03260 [Gemmatimonadota bacterium]